MDTATQLPPGAPVDTTQHAFRAAYETNVVSFKSRDKVDANVDDDDLFTLNPLGVGLRSGEDKRFCPVVDVNNRRQVIDVLSDDEEHYAVIIHYTKFSILV